MSSYGIVSSTVVRRVSRLPDISLAPLVREVIFPSAFVILVVREEMLPALTPIELVLLDTVVDKVPTVVDRVIQQALVQVLTPIFEPTFSEYSYGFRPNRRCQNAIDRTLELINEGYEWIVDLDLEKFFDNVPHDKLIRIIDNEIKDSNITSLIMTYLKSGVMVNGTFEETNVGTPQGGNLSPLLSNIYLTLLDKELETRGLHFARYADDCVIFVRTENAAKRVMHSITRFIENKLKLKVNATKTHIAKPNNLKYLGFSFYKDNKQNVWKSKPHKESFIRLFIKLKTLVKRSWSVDLTYRIKKINEVLRGWINYYRSSSMKVKLEKLGAWLRNAIRVIIWKQWKLPRTRVKNLMKLGMPEWKAYRNGNTRKGYWAIAGSGILHHTITNERLARRGYYDISEAYKSLHSI